MNKRTQVLYTPSARGARGSTLVVWITHTHIERCYTVDTMNEDTTNTLPEAQNEPVQSESNTIEHEAQREEIVSNETIIEQTSQENSNITTQNGQTIKIEQNPYIDPITKDFKIGNPGGGRPKDTPAKKLEKKAVKMLVKEYVESLAQALPHISPVLQAKALKGDMNAIRELNDRVIGKAEQKTRLDLGDDTLKAISVIKHGGEDKPTA